MSPFNWTVFVSDEQTHRFAHVNLVRKEPRRYQPGDGFVARIDSPYLPVEQAIWVKRTRYGETDQALIKEAWNAEALYFFRWFADLPAFDGMSDALEPRVGVDLRLEPRVVHRPEFPHARARNRCRSGYRVRRRAPGRARGGANRATSFA